MKPVFSILTIVYLSIFSSLTVSAADVATPEEAIEVAFGGEVTRETTPPSVIAESAAKRATLIEQYSAEIRASNPNLSESDIYAAASSRADTSYASSTPIDMIVSEKVPGATCTCAAKGYEGQDECPSDLAVSEKLYTCSVGKGMTSFQNVIREITKWFIYITMLLGVLALVGAGILWAWGSESEEYTKKAKGWAINIIVGLALLFTFRYILGFLAPWVFM